MRAVAGVHSERVARARALRTRAGRKEQGRFAFEGPTLLSEARSSGVAIAEIFATAAHAENNVDVAHYEREGVEVFTVDERTAAKLSDLDTPAGIVSTAALRWQPLQALGSATLALVFAGMSDPGNAGTLLRSAEAFGAGVAVFDPGGVDPYHPKVVRAAMGSIFRLPPTLAHPAEFDAAAALAGMTILGLDSQGIDIAAETWPRPCAVVVGHERRGLGAWEGVCARRVAIGMQRRTESLNAAVAGSIALFEASRRRPA